MIRHSMMLNSFKLVFRKKSFKSTSLYYQHLGESWVSTNGEKAVKIKPKELKKHYTWHNTWLLCAPSTASEQPDESNIDLLSTTPLGDKAIYDYGPNPLTNFADKLRFIPRGIIGTIGLATAALSKIKRPGDEFILLLLKDRMILNQYSGDNLKKARSIKLRQTDNITSLLSTLIPKLIQSGIRLGQSKCQLIYIKDEFKQKTIESIQNPLSLKKSDITTIPSYADFVMAAWWEQTIKPQPAYNSFSLPQLGSFWLLFLGVIVLGLVCANQMLPNITTVQEQQGTLTNNNIIGALNAEGKSAKIGGKDSLLSLKYIPANSWLTNFRWRPGKKIFIEGFSQKQVNAYKIQESMSKKMAVPISDLELKFYGISSNGDIRWSLGEKINS